MKLGNTWQHFDPWHSHGHDGVHHNELSKPSNRNHGTATTEIRQYHNCSSRTFPLDLHKGAPRRTFSKDRQDLNARTSSRWFQPDTGDLHKMFSRTCTKSCEDIERISAGHIQEFLTRTFAKSCKGHWQHATAISTRSSFNKCRKGLGARSSEKDLLLWPDHRVLIQELPKSLQ